MTTTLVAGVDSSTQSCKVVVRRLDDGAVVRSGSARHPDGTEVDPERWWSALQEAISAAGGLDDVAAVSVGGQQHGMVVLDEAGRVIRPALLWNDTRSAPAARALVDEIGAAELSERTGSVPVASFTSTKLRWLRDAEARNAERVAAVALPHDWLTWRLRGFGVDEPRLDRLTTDRSDASGTGYWNPSTDSYDLDLLEQALGHSARVPDVLGPDERSGRLAGQSTVIGAGAGDNAAAALGLGAEAGDVVISIGTSGTVFAVSDHPVPDRTGTVAGFADASGRFLPLIATLNAARVLDTMADLLGTDHQSLGDLAITADPGSDGMVLTPYFAGERTPNLPDATASVRGMSLANATRPNLARASIEGMLCSLADGLDAITRLGVAADRILLIGGAAQNVAVQKITAQVFAQPVSVPEPGEYVAAGAARQAAWALTGELPDWSIAPASTYEVDHRAGILAAYHARSA